ncbi:hypothetical protein EDD85DRAFT_782972 [Armillaria nabsnona]|nr:hypothetical protein EDD85DRAFT_782972 [Armillaria nabsnona]
MVTLQNATGKFSKWYPKVQHKNSSSKGRSRHVEKNITLKRRQVHHRIGLGAWVYNSPRKFRRKVMHGLDPQPLQTIHPPATVNDGQKVEITGSRYLGSYSWLKGRKPAILVPGAPPYLVPQTDALHFAPRLWLPNCHSLLCLTAFAHAQRRGFRMDLQLAGSKTILCTRWEPRVVMNANPGGYGRSFELMRTRPALGCEHATSHHRVITYDLAGMKMVVRAEVDACLPDPNGKAADVQEVPQSALVELTTKSSPRNRRWSYKDMQMCLSQTPNLIYGVHQNGVFNKVVKKKKNLDNVKDHRESKLRLLRRVLEDVQQLVIRSGPRGRLTLVYEDTAMKVYQRNLENSSLPEEYLKMFQPQASICIDLLDR